MSTFSKVIPSGSVDGKGIILSATSTPGDTIHTSVSGSVNMDEIYIYAVNNGLAAITLTIEWGNSTSKIVQSVPAADGAHLIIPGWPLNNTEIVKAFGASAGITIFAFVNRIVP